MNKSTSKLIDSHCHIHGLGDLYKTQNCIMCNIFDLSNSEELERIPRWSGYKIAGVHPNSVDNITIDASEQVLHSIQDQLIGFGETGIDLHYGRDLAKQLEFFRSHIKLGLHYNKPVIVHSRSCDIDLILKEKQAASTFIFHSFNYDTQSMYKATKAGCYISFSGIVTFKNAAYLRDAAANCDLNYILTETDSPYLAPVPHRGKPNKPDYVIEVYKTIAQAKSMCVEQLKEVVYNNFCRCFSIKNAI